MNAEEIEVDVEEVEMVEDTPAAVAEEIGAPVVVEEEIDVVVATTVALEDN